MKKLILVLFFAYSMTSNAIYNLSAFYVKTLGVFYFTYDTLGGYVNGINSFTTGQSFISGGYDGVFSTPKGLAVDTTNDFLYVADSSNGRVQKIVASTGAPVGSIGEGYASGTCSSGVQPGWCTGGSFFAGGKVGGINAPNSVLIDPVNDYLYVGDANKVNRFIASTGASAGAIGSCGTTGGGTCVSGVQSGWCTGCTTFGTGTSSANASFSEVRGMALDRTNDVLIVLDTSRHRVQKLRASTGAFLGVIGRGNTVTGTCVSGAAQSGWCVPTAGATFTGTDSTDGGFNYPTSVQIDTVNDFMFVGDHFRVQKFVYSTGAFVGSIGNTSSSTGTCAASGAQAGWCTGGTFASGTSVSGGFYSGLYGGTIDIDVTNDFMYVGDSNRVQKFTLSTGAFVGLIGRVSPAAGTCVFGTQSSWCTGASGFGSSSTVDGQFSTISGVAIDSTNNRLYVSDESGNRIQKFVLSTGAATIGAIGGQLVASNAYLKGRKGATGSTDGIFSTPSDIAVDSTNGYFYVYDEAIGKISKFNLATGAFVGAIGNSTASGTCTAGSQSGWCTGGVFSKATPDGQLNSTSTSALAIDVTNNRLYAGDTVKVMKFNLSTGAFLGTIGKSSAAGTCTAGAQAGWCTGGSYSTGASDGMFSSIKGIAVDSEHDYLYISDASNYRVQKFVASTGAFVGAVGKSTAAGTCIAGAQTGWCTGGSFTYDNAVDGAFYTMNKIVYDGTNDAIYVAGSGKIQKFTASTGAYVGGVGYIVSAGGTCVAGVQSSWCKGSSFSSGSGAGGFNSAVGLTLDINSDTMYVAETTTSRLQKLRLSTGASLGYVGYVATAAGTCVAGTQTTWCSGATTSSGAADGQFNSPLAIAIDTVTKKIYAADSSNYRVQRLTPNN